MLASVHAIRDAKVIAMDLLLSLDALKNRDLQGVNTAAKPSDPGGVNHMMREAARVDRVFTGGTV